MTIKYFGSMEAGGKKSPYLYQGKKMIAPVTKKMIAPKVKGANKIAEKVMFRSKYSK